MGNTPQFDGITMPAIRMHTRRMRKISLKPDPDIDAPIEEREPGGMGIFICKKLMDSVDYAYQDGLNVLTLEKEW